MYYLFMYLFIFNQKNLVYIITMYLLNCPILSFFFSVYGNSNIFAWVSVNKLALIIFIKGAELHISSFKFNLLFVLQLWPKKMSLSKLWIIKKWQISGLFSWV